MSAINSETLILIKEIFEWTRYTNQEIVNWINTTLKDDGREGAFALLRFLAAKYPDLRERLGVETQVENLS